MFHNTWPFIGSLGRLVEVPFTASENVSRADRYVESTTVEGARRVQVRPVAPRSWSVDVSGASADELSGLEAFAQGAWGSGPWHWVSVAAQVGNLLTPREAQLLDRAVVSSASVQDAGPVRDSDGAWSPRSVTVTLASGWASLARGVPVIPGMPFTFSCDVQGNTLPGQVHVRFADAAGGTVSDNSADAPNAGMHRVSWSGAVPAGAVEAHVGVRSQTVVATRPQVTWTPGPVPFSAGHGCRSAVVDGVSSDLLVVNSDGPVSGVGFTVLEVA